jgi:hypothetical protein
MIRGSHGRIPEEDRYKPVFISDAEIQTNFTTESIRAEQVYDLLLGSLGVKQQASK